MVFFTCIVSFTVIVDYLRFGVKFDLLYLCYIMHYSYTLFSNDLSL